MRIITGTAKGKTLLTPKGMDVRPTTEKVKEAIFSMIQFDLDGTYVLDLFGGTGQLALEALSRGASGAVITDNSRESVDIIRQNISSTKMTDRCSVIRSDSSLFIKRYSSGRKFNVVFIDPPYDSGLVHESLRLISEHDICSYNPVIVCETDTHPAKKKNQKEKRDTERRDESILTELFNGDSDLMDKYEIIRSKVYGRTRITVLTIPEAKEEETDAVQ